METELKDLIGKSVEKIFINNKYLKFVTDGGEFIYKVSGDCCSSSFFYDFYGVKNILGKRVKEVKEVKLMPGDVLVKNEGNYELTQVYGYQIFNDRDEYGEPTTSVFSFRNESNGYYGGSIQLVSPKEKDSYIYGDYKGDTGEMKEVTEDIIEVSSLLPH